MLAMLATYSYNQVVLFIKEVANKQDFTVS